MQPLSINIDVVLLSRPYYITSPAQKKKGLSTLLLDRPTSVARACHTQPPRNPLADRLDSRARNRADRRAWLAWEAQPTMLGARPGAQRREQSGRATHPRLGRVAQRRASGRAEPHSHGPRARLLPLCSGIGRARLPARPRSPAAPDPRLSPPVWCACSERRPRETKRAEAPSWSTCSRLLLHMCARV